MCESVIQLFPQSTNYVLFLTQSAHKNSYFILEIYQVDSFELKYNISVFQLTDVDSDKKKWKNYCSMIICVTFWQSLLYLSFCLLQRGNRNKRVSDISVCFVNRKSKHNKNKSCTVPCVKYVNEFH